MTPPGWSWSDPVDSMILHAIKGLWLGGDPELSVLLAGEGASVSSRLKMADGLLSSPWGAVVHTRRAGERL